MGSLLATIRTLIEVKSIVNLYYLLVLDKWPIEHIHLHEYFIDLKIRRILYEKGCLWCQW
jgi:hypothetical protein